MNRVFHFAVAFCFILLMVGLIATLVSHAALAELTGIAAYCTLITIAILLLRKH